jgi:hypothetical protein
MGEGIILADNISVDLDHITRAANKLNQSLVVQNKCALATVGDEVSASPVRLQPHC